MASLDVLGPLKCSKFGFYVLAFSLFCLFDLMTCLFFKKAKKQTNEKNKTKLWFIPEKMLSLPHLNVISMW